MERTFSAELDPIAISVKSHRILKQLLQENPILEQIMLHACNPGDASAAIRTWVEDILKQNPDSYSFYRREIKGRDAFEKLPWKDIAAIRILDYIDNAGREFTDLNLKGRKVESDPFMALWMAIHKGTGGAKPAFFLDMLQLFRQFSGKDIHNFPSEEKLRQWMDRWVSGLDPRIVALHEENRNRILNIIIRKIDEGEINDSKFFFEPGMTHEEKFNLALEWWKDRLFHLRFAIRNPDDLNEYLNYSLSMETMVTLRKAAKKGIPFFVNPYYLSLLLINQPPYAIGADLPLRLYILYSRELVSEYGTIEAWEKEDKVEPGKPNAAGWLLPNSHNIHRRYPEVAILIPDTMGRACGGLCASCQRMYDFQSGHLNFNLNKLKPGETWEDKLRSLLTYFEHDSQLRDILITGGDALMSSDKSLKLILDEVYNMALRKIEANKQRKDGEKHAEMLRIRLGTRLPVYLPQRITPELVEILREFKHKASQIGIRKFIIQTHFESPLEVTPEARAGVEKLISAGWLVVNQMVFNATTSRRGHSAKLRQVLNNIGILNYYTFSVKGYMENKFSFATNERAIQEQREEKIFGRIPEKYYELVKHFPDDAEHIVQQIQDLMKEARLPFLGTDRNVLNLPGVGKSLTFRTIGITRYGRRILEYEHDATRNHSPIIEEIGNVIIIESKSIREYLQQLEKAGENPDEYQSIWGYSIGETEERVPLYDYPDYDFQVTPLMTNLVIEKK